MHLDAAAAAAWMQARLAVLPAAVRDHLRGDLDVEGIAHGWSSARGPTGCLQVAGGRWPAFDAAEAAPGQNLVVAGSMVVDGVFTSTSHVFVWGDLLAQVVVNDGYLVVAGDLRCGRLLGRDHEGARATLVHGGLIAEEVLTRWSHPVQAGSRQVGRWIDDEDDATAAAEVVRVWGVGRGDGLGTLAAWARGRGPVVAEPTFPLAQLEAAVAAVSASAPGPVGPPAPPWVRAVLDLDAPQRELLRRLGQALATAPPMSDAERAAAAAAITRAVRSPKLADERAALLAALGKPA